MTLKVENRGSGFIGEIGANWSINYNSTPAILGSGSGRLGDISFSAGCNETTKFTIDNYISVQHYYDNPNQRALGAFDGHIRSVEVHPENDFAQFGMTSLLASLDVTRTTSPNPSGTYQRTFKITPTSYEILGTTYWIGGRYVSQGSQNVFINSPVEVYDVACAPGFVYLLASGGHSGEVVIVMRSHGQLHAVWPVYSDATDTSNPNSRHIAYQGGHLWVGQSAAFRVKKFTATGAFVHQFGSFGSGNGQFQAISGIAASNGFDSLYVSDSVLGRVQTFLRTTGAYNFQWGTSGTGTGNLVFNAPNGLSVDDETNHVFVSDHNARVREYSSGTYVSQPMGSYDFTSGTSTGEFAKNTTIQTTFDHRGNAYAYDGVNVFKYTRKGIVVDWTDSGSTPVQSWTTSGSTTLPGIAATPDGILHTVVTGAVAQYAGSLGSTGANLMYLVALAKSDMPLNMLVLADDDYAGTVAYPSFRDNIWSSICDLLSVTGNSAIVLDDKIAFAKREDVQFTLPKRGLYSITPIKLDSRDAGRSIQIVNQNSSWLNFGTMYSATADGNRVFSIDVNDINYVTVNQGTYPAHIYDPTPITSNGVAGDGEYIVTDKDGVSVDATLWSNYGGNVHAEPGAQPGDILLTLYGPGLEIPGHPAPYKIATVSGQAALNINGQGVTTNPQVITIGTGLSEDVTSRQIAISVDSPFVHDATRSYTEGSWMAYNSGTPNQRFELTIRYSRGISYNTAGGAHSGTPWLVGTVVVIDEAQYIVESARANNSTIVMSLYRYSRTGTPVDSRISPRMEEIWSGKSAGDFDAFWSGHTAQDITIAPYRNPFGVAVS